MLQALLPLAQRGDAYAQTELVRLYEQRIAAFVIAQTDREHYEDLCQAVFVKMILALPKLQKPEAFEAWLFLIARNVCRDHLRRQKWRRKLFVPLGLHDAAEETPKAKPDVEALLQQLPEEDRALLQMQLDKYSYEELAKAQHASVPAVKSRLFRARARLRALLGGQS